MREHSLLNVSAALSETASDVGDNSLSILIVEYFVPQCAGLLIVIVGVLVCVASSISLEFDRCLGIGLVLYRSVNRIGLVVWSRSVVAINRHESISDIVCTHASTVRAVDWNLIVVGAKSVTVSVRIVQKTSLKHLVV